MIILVIALAACVRGRCYYSFPYVPITIESSQRGIKEARELILPIFKGPHCQQDQGTIRYDSPASVILPGDRFPDNFISARMDSARLVDFQGFALDDISLSGLFIYFQLGTEAKFLRFVQCSITTTNGTTYLFNLSKDIDLILPESIQSYQCGTTLI
jgi:hypothetical protein